MSSGMMAGLDVLRELGLLADRLEGLAVARGGFVVPGGDSALSATPEWENEDGTARAEGIAEAGPAAGSRGRPPAEAAATGEAPHAFRALIGHGADAREFNELVAYHPSVTVAASSANFDILTLTAGLFHGSRSKARLFLEIPAVARGERFQIKSVPEIRVWSYWETGATSGMPISSHHENPDGSMCVCRQLDWMRGRDLLVDFVNFSVLWVVKALHDQVLGFYPGLQHLQPYVRRARDRGNEYCGCGNALRYRDCCRQRDLALRSEEVAAARVEIARRYSAELLAGRRMANPLRIIGRTTSPHAA